MENKEREGFIYLIAGGILFLLFIIASEILSETFSYAGYIFGVSSLVSLYLMLLGVKKTIQYTISKRE